MHVYSSDDAHSYNATPQQHAHHDQQDVVWEPPSPPRDGLDAWG